MRYTLLRKAPDGIILCAYHERRLALHKGTEAFEYFVQFARNAAPGVWAVRIDEQGMHTESRPGSRLHDDMETRLARSPVIARQGTLAKGDGLGLYDGVRVAGCATLLTSQDGAEIYEVCSAAVLGWDGHTVVCVPKDRPRVNSTAESAVREHLPHVQASISASSSMPILLVNAVKGTCIVNAPGRDVYPSDIVQRIQNLLRDLTFMPG